MAIERARFAVHQNFWRQKVSNKYLIDIGTDRNQFDYLFTVLTETSYTRAVDWWGLGVLIFEMLVGEVMKIRCLIKILFDFMCYFIQMQFYLDFSHHSLVTMKKKYSIRLLMMKFAIQDFYHSKPLQSCVE